MLTIQRTFNQDVVTLVMEFEPIKNIIPWAVVNTTWAASVRSITNRKCTVPSVQIFFGNSQQCIVRRNQAIFTHLITIQKIIQQMRTVTFEYIEDAAKWEELSQNAVMFQQAYILQSLAQKYLCIKSIKCILPSMKAYRYNF